MTRKLSVIIPTLQKNLDFLNQLINSLINDEAVGEIIVIDNSTKGFEYNNEKVRVIVPKQNLFVNPSWNLGAKEAKYEYLGILNDDICIPEGFCGSIINEITESTGVIGTNGYSMINKSYEPEKITDNSYILEETAFSTFNFGVMMFLHRNCFYEIPTDLKIFYGDDYLFFKNKKNHKKNYVIEGLKMYHYGSLSSKNFSDVIKKENSLYKKHTLTIWDRFFSIERTRSKLTFRILFFFSFGIKQKDFRQTNYNISGGK